MNLENKHQAQQLLCDLGAPEHLIKHGELVCEATELLLHGLKEMGLKCDENLAQIGALLHDCGKILHPEELYKSGNKHEQAGKELLLAKK